MTIAKIVFIRINIDDRVSVIIIYVLYVSIIVSSF